MIRKPLVIVAAILLILTVFLVDILSTLDGAIAVLYIAAILLLAPLGRRFVLGAGLLSAALTTIAFLFEHMGHLSQGASTRFAVSLIAIGSTALLSLRDRSSRTTLGEQARILELSHDTVIIRDASDRIIFWNDGAEQLYGFRREEVLGKACDALLQCRFPAEEVKAALERDGVWSGEVSRTRRDGTRIVLQSRWLSRHDPDGRAIGVIESSADLTQQRKADADRLASEERYRTMFEGSAVPTWEADWSATFEAISDRLPAGEDLARWLPSHPDFVREALDRSRILMANSAAVELFEVSSEADLLGMNLRGLHLPESSEALGRLLVALMSGSRHVECDMRGMTFKGRIRDIVFRVTLLPDDVRGSRILAMAIDVTERNETRARLEQTSAELAHAARVSMLGQLAASIAHEVNQPLTAIINYGKSGKRWLSRPDPDLAELGSCLDKIVSNGSRAADVIGRVRSLARKNTPEVAALDLDELIHEAIALLEREARAENVTVRFLSPGSVPLVFGDRVQVQQVLVNLLINAIHAMHGVERPKEICLRTELDEEAFVRIAVEDCGSGFPGDTAARLFEPFFTTKKEGMGIGLSICRSIVEGQGGRISASNNEVFGATVAFTLPAHVAERGSEHDFIL
jgi:PAS domain S-box-containing protein